MQIMLNFSFQLLVDFLRQKVLFFPRWAKKLLAILADTILILASFAFTLTVHGPGENVTDPTVLFFVTYLCYFICSIYFGVYSTVNRYMGHSTIVLILKTMALFFVMNVMFTSLMIGTQASIRYQVTLVFLLTFGILISRFTFAIWFRYNPNRDVTLDLKNVLVYGAGFAGRQLVECLQNNGELNPVGYIDDDPKIQNQFIGKLKVHSSLELKEVIKKGKIKEILIAIPSLSRMRKVEIIEELEFLNVHIRSLPTMSEIANGKINFTDLRELNIDDLLGRSSVPPNENLMHECLFNKVILVTGAAGSIGSELCREILKYNPSTLILLDFSEFGLFTLNSELRGAIHQSNRSIDEGNLSIIPVLASVVDREYLRSIFQKYKPQVVFHSAAYKHVHLVETNQINAIKNNIYGTLNCALESIDSKVENFILVSTDKAVRPTNVMGLTKRVSELILQGLNESTLNLGGSRVKFSIVRFGNVLGSSGSVVPIFESQIKEGKDITLTSKLATRYFMSISEAAQLVIQAGSISLGGEVFVLDMGSPVRIYDLAVKMIKLSGLILKDESSGAGDIGIKVIGLRAGEKLHEELLISGPPVATIHEKILKSNEGFIDWEELAMVLNELNEKLFINDKKGALNLLKKIVPESQLHSISH